MSNTSYIPKEYAEYRRKAKFSPDVACAACSMRRAIPLPVRGRADTPGVAGTSRLACEHAGGSHLSEEKASGKQEESIKNNRRCSRPRTVNAPRSATRYRVRWFLPPLRQDPGAIWRTCAFLNLAIRIEKGSIAAQVKSSDEP